MLKAFTYGVDLNALGLRKAVALLCVALQVAAHGAYAEEMQDKSDRRGAALEALGLINADIVELNRIADYQAELIGLAKADRAAAVLARRGRGSCAERVLVRELCGALSVSFPEQLAREGLD